MIRFGPSGNDELFYEEGHNSTEEAPEWISALGLNAFEYSFGRGVRLKSDKAKRIAEKASQYDIQMSVHAPYFINLAAHDDERVQKNIGYFTQSAEIALALGAERMVFHPGAVTKMTREQALSNALVLMKKVLKALDDSGLGEIRLCAETMGKRNQLGTLEEVIALCRLDERLLPAVDFGHMYARSCGECDGREAFEAVFNTLENGVGFERTKRMHIHFSHIEYTPAGEKRHLRLSDESFGPSWTELAMALAGRKYEPVVICESNGTMATDAAEMRKIYEACLGSPQES